jgi:hypothetical protein
MKLKKTAVKATLAGALGAAAVGLGAGLSHADPFLPPPWPTPTDPGLSVQGPSVSGRASTSRVRAAALARRLSPVRASRARV